MAEQDESASADQWMGCSCPQCRVLFRVSVDSRGQQVECPTCGELVTIPLVNAPPAGEGGKAVVRAEAAAPEPVTEKPEREARDPSKFRKIEPRAQRGEGEGPDGRPALIRKKKKRKPLAESKKEEFEWEKVQSPARRRRRLSGPRFLVAGLVILAVVVGLVGLVNLGGKDEAPETTGGEEPVKRPGLTPDIPEAPIDETQAEIGSIEMKETVTDIDAVVRRFLSATSVEGMLGLVRGGDDVRARIKSYYEAHELVPVTPQRIAPTGSILKSGGLWSVNVVLADFSQRPIAVEQVESGYLVDWESWVGYSEVPWKEFAEKRILEEKEFRVRLSPVSYYNFDFVDERKWKSYRLESPDREHVLYGYVLRDSTVNGRLSQLGAGSGPVAYVLKLRFPEAGTRQDQVLIESVVCSGWVTNNDGK